MMLDGGSTATVGNEDNIEKGLAFLTALIHARIAEAAGAEAALPELAYFNDGSMASEDSN